MRKLIIITAITLLSGCSTMQQLGTIGTHEIWEVTTRDIMAPSTQTILVHNPTDKSLTKVEGGVGPSLLGQIAGPAAVVGGAYFIGKGLEDSGDTTNVTSDSDAQGGRAGAVSGSASISAAKAGAKAGAQSGAVGIGVKK